VRRDRPRDPRVRPRDRHHGRTVRGEPVPQPGGQSVLLGSPADGEGPSGIEHHAAAQHGHHRGRGRRPARSPHPAQRDRVDERFRTPHHTGGADLIGYLAGAEYMSGREPESQFGASSAPEVPDQNMLGSTILFYSKDIGSPSKFIAPPFAVDVVAAGIPEHRVIRQDMRGCAFWWIEWGGELDVVHDNEQIRDELQAVCYGLWDDIKNSGEFDAETLTLGWVGAVPGKRV